MKKVLISNTRSLGIKPIRLWASSKASIFMSREPSRRRVVGFGDSCIDSYLEVPNTTVQCCTTSNTLCMVSIHCRRFTDPRTYSENLLPSTPLRHKPEHCYSQVMDHVVFAAESRMKVHQGRMHHRGEGGHCNAI